MRQLVLGSQSARRKEILTFLGMQYDAIASDFPEEDVRFTDFESVCDYVLAIATGKSLVLSKQYHDAVILTADTTVYLDGQVYNKPRNLDHAREMLRSLRGKTHQVCTAVVGVDTLTGEKEATTVTSFVEFFPFSDEHLEAYISTGESLGKAGSYAIQLGAKTFVKKVEGSLSNIVGLPIEETVAILESFSLVVPVNVPELVHTHFTFDSTS